MNDDRNYQKNKAAVLELLRLGMPNTMIQLGVGISPSTAHNYVARLREEKLWEGNSLVFDQTIPKMVKLFAYLNFNRTPPEEMKFTIISRGELLACLSTALDTQRIIDIVDRSSKSLSKLRQFSFEPGIPEAYQNFLNVFNPNHLKPHMSGQALWNIYLRSIINGNKMCDHKKGLSGWQEAVINEIVEYYMDIIRPNIMPVFTCEIVNRINNRLFPTLPERELKFIKMYFGISEPKQNLKEIAEQWEITHSRAGQIYSRIIQRIKHEERLESILAIPLTWEKVTKILDSKIPPIPVKPPEKPSDPSEVLRYRLKDLNFSARAKNVFRAMGEVNTLEDLIRISENDLYKFRNLGLKTVKEIKSILKKYDLTLAKRTEY